METQNRVCGGHWKKDWKPELSSEGLLRKRKPEEFFLRGGSALRGLTDKNCAGRAKEQVVNSTFESRGVMAFNSPIRLTLPKEEEGHK